MRVVRKSIRARSDGTSPAPARKLAPAPSASPSTRFTRTKSEILRADSEAPAPARVPAAHKRARLLLHLAHVLVAGSTHVGRKRIENAPVPLVQGKLAGGRAHDLRAAREQRERESLVDLVVRDLPSAANDSARRKIEPPSRAPDLDLLMQRQPEATLHERVLSTIEMSSSSLSR